jgi:hypothetical protein
MWAGVLQSFEAEIATLSISLLVFMAAESLFITIAEGSTMEIAGVPKPPVINTTEVFDLTFFILSLVPLAHVLAYLHLQ